MIQLKTLNNDFFSAIPVALFFRMFGILSTYLFTYLIANFYGSAALGYFSLLQTYLLVVIIFSKFGLDTASLKLVSENKVLKQHRKLNNDYYLILKIMIVFSLLLSLISYILSYYISHNIFNLPEINFYIKLFSFLILPCSILYLNAESFRGLKIISLYSLLNNTTISFIASIFLLFFYYNGFRQEFYPLYSFFISAIILSLFSILLWKLYLNRINSLNKNDQNDENKQVSLQKLFNLSTPMLLSNSMAYLLNWSSVLILGIYLLPSEVGYFSVALKVSMVTSIFLYSVNSIAAPKLSEYYAKNDFKSLKKIILKTSSLIFWFAFPISLITIFFSDRILFFFGSEFYAAKNILIILTIGQFLNSICGSVGYILQMTGKQKTFQNIITISTIINISLNFILIPNYGLIGAAISNVISICLWNISSMIYVYKYYNVVTLSNPFLIFKS